MSLFRNKRKIEVEIDKNTVSDHVEENKKNQAPLEKKIDKTRSMVTPEEENKAFDKTIEYFINQESELMRQLNEAVENREALKKKAIDKARENFSMFIKDEDSIEKLIVRFENYMWGYYILEPLLRDPEIQDITLYSYERIRCERRGKWEGTDIKFASKSDYDKFIRTICTRNKVSLSRIKAQPKFTDVYNDPEYRLRFNLSAGFLNSDGETELHIRKIPKNKMLFSDLVEAGYITKEQSEFLSKSIKEGKNILFSGSNGSGKTYGLNAAIEEIPLGKSGIIMQESDELFTDNPDFFAQHVVVSEGDGKISYGLKELSNRGLMDARDVFVLGEVKSGNDAAEIPTIVATGSQVLLTGHGANELDAIYKIADYIKQETGYEFDQCLRFFSNIVVVYCKKFKVTGMSYIKGWDYDKNDLTIYPLDEKGNIHDGRVSEFNRELDQYFS